MSFSLDDDISEKLASLSNKGKLIRNRSLKAGRDLVIKNLEANVPYENISDRSFKSQRDMDKKSGKKTTFKHLKDDIVYSGVSQTGSVKIGFGKDTYWRVHFVELGTMHQPARPFISTTLQNTESAYKSIIEEQIKKELRI